MDYIADGHAQFHHWYEQQKQQNGTSCCNDKDCRPALDWKQVADGYKFKIDDGRWVFVPDSKVQGKSPDHRAHYCGVKDSHDRTAPDVVFCAFLPMAV